MSDDYIHETPAARQARLNIQLHAYAQGGSPEDIDSALAAGARIDNQTARGETPLMTAINCDMHELVAHFLTRGANPNIGDMHGTSPLILAASKGDTISLKLLMDAGADIDQADVLGETPLMVAINYESVAVARVLLEAGCNLTLHNLDDRDARKVALLYRDMTFVKMIDDELAARKSREDEKLRVADAQETKAAAARNRRALDGTLPPSPQPRRPRFN